MTTTSTFLAARGDDLVDHLNQVKQLGLVRAYEKTNPTGNKLVWVLELPNGDAAETVELDSPQLKALLAGVHLATSTNAARRSPKMTPTREAILADGRVVLDIKKPNDKAYMKRLRNGLFSDAYAVGLKGQFHVTREGDKLVGETEAYRREHHVPAPLKESA